MTAPRTTQGNGEAAAAGTEAAAAFVRPAIEEERSGSGAAAGGADAGNTRTETARRRYYVAWTWMLAIALAGVVIFLLNILAIPVGIIIWTAVFVFILHGIVDRLERHGVNRILGTTVSYVVMFGVLALIGFLIFSPSFGVGAQLNQLGAQLPDILNQASTWANGQYVRYEDALQNDAVRSWVQSALAELESSGAKVASMSAQTVVTAGTNIVNTLITVGFALVVAFWMLIELPRLGREASRFVGDAHQEDFRMIGITVNRVMGGYIKATLIQCALIGVGCGVLYAIIGLPSSGALGAITGILNIIPIVGPWLGGALAFIASVFVDPFTAVVALVGTIVIQQVVYTFISPKIMGDSVDIHPALTIIALCAGSAIGGAGGSVMGALIGALLSIPLIAVAKSLFVYYFEKKTGRRLVSEEGVFFKGDTGGNDAADPVADAAASAPRRWTERRSRRGHGKRAGRR